MEITVALAITAAVRLLVPLLIWKMRIVGMLLAVLADALDVFLLDSLGLAFNEDPYQGLHYQFFDKWLDMYYLSFGLVVSLSWKSALARNTSIFLFAFRLIGLVLFEVTGMRKLFFFFPNLFENFYLFYVIADKFFPRLVPKTILQLAFVLLVLYLPKLLQEWVLHYEQINTWFLIKDFLGLPF